MKKSILFTALASLSLSIQAGVTLIPYDCSNCKNLDKNTVSYDWLIKSAPIKQAKPLVRHSKSYQLNVTGAQLHKGVELFTQGDEAIVRIDSADKTLSLNKLSLKPQNKKLYTLIQASQQLADQHALKDNPYFQSSQSVFQLKPELGHGHFTLQSRLINPSDNKTYLIHVFDKKASTQLSISTDKVNYFYGDEITVDIKVSDDQIVYPIIKITADLIDPDGKTYPLRLMKLGFNHYQALTQINSKVNYEGRNWYVRVDTESIANDETIYRHANSALSYTIPSATIGHIAPVQSTVGVEFIADITTSTQSRYGIEGILYGHDSNNQLRPMMIAQTSAMLSPGGHKLNLTFHQDKLSVSSLKPPYEIKQVRMIDYGQLRQVTP